MKNWFTVNNIHEWKLDSLDPTGEVLELVFSKDISDAILDLFVIRWL